MKIKDIKESRERPQAWEDYRTARQDVRESLNHLNRILTTYYDRGPRYDNPDDDTLRRLAVAADIIKKATHELAAGIPDDKPDPWDD